MIKNKLNNNLRSPRMKSRIIANLPFEQSEKALIFYILAQKQVKMVGEPFDFIFKPCDIYF